MYELCECCGKPKRPKVDGVISSPPYANSIDGSGEGPGARFDFTHHKPDTAKRQSSANGYGETPGNLGRMAGEGFEAAVRYLATPNNRSIIGVWQPVSTVERQSPEEVSGASLAATNTLAKSSLDDRNPQSMGNTSQPQNATSLCPLVGENHTPTGKAATTNGAATHGESNAAPRSKGTVTNAPDAVQPAVYKSTTNETEKIAAGNGTTVSTTSKPYASHVTAKNRRSISLKRELARSAVLCSTPQSQGARYVPINAVRHPLNSLNSDTTKAANENLTPSPDNFWAAARVIVEQTYSVLSPGGYAAWVTKRFVRNKQIVEFSEQWAQLCEAVGFERVEWIRAMLTEEHGHQLDIFGESHPKGIKRASFFRRLYEKKYPENAIDWEDVLIMRRPL